MSRKRAFLHTDNTAEFVCPDCGAELPIRLAERVRTSTPVRVRVRCDCGKGHAVFLERRASVRKEVDIPGLFMRVGDRTKRPMRVRNLSRTGILFEPSEPVDLEVGDELAVEFELENADRLHVLKDAAVRRIAGPAVGAEFDGAGDERSYDRVYDLALALYRQPAAR